MISCVGCTISGGKPPSNHCSNDCDNSDDSSSGSSNAWLPQECTYPSPPINVAVISAFKIGVLDLRWDSPSILAKNTPWAILGVNIYRSTSSERGPYFRVNREPVGGTYYRDATQNILIQDEIVDWDTSWINRGEAPNSKEWRFKARNVPLVKQQGNSIYANSPRDVLVTVDGRVAEVQQVIGQTGEIVLVNITNYDYERQKYIPPVLPTGPESVVSVTYYTRTNHFQTNLDRKVWYRITTVGQNPQTKELVETPLDWAPPIVNLANEQLDWVWREAVRRNNWILEQGGERVKVFIRKSSGVPCYCGKDVETMAYNDQPKNSCPSCFGTSFVGGYDGPYDLIIAPEDGDRNVEQSPDGRFLNLQYEVWTGPSPLLSQRDFIVRMNNERYAIGSMRRPSHRGNILQQSFQLTHLDQKDIRYQVPVEDPASLSWPETRYRPAVVQGGRWLEERPPQGPYPVGPDYQQTPLVTEKENIPDEREQRSRVPVGENTTY